MLRSFALGIGVACAVIALPHVATAEDGMQESTFGFNGISGLIGIVMPEGDLDSSLGLEAHVNLGAPFASVPELVFLPGISYWSSSYDVPLSDDDYTVSEFGILADVAYVIPVGEPENGFTVYGGGGLGLFFASFDAPEINTPFGTVDGGSASSTDIGFSLVGGASKAVGEQLDVLAQLRLKFGGDGGDTVGIHGGVQYRFAK